LCLTSDAPGGFLWDTFNEIEGTIKGTGAVLFFHVFREVGSQQLCSCTLPSIDQVFFYPGGSVLCWTLCVLLLSCWSLSVCSVL
ncbi:hypothetical protein Goari_022477, partial [Gossypium aridum]|nr:hypothetical protein [Gossypium aridum]